MTTQDSNLIHFQFCGAQAYEGSRAALEQSGLIPPGTPFPGEIPGKRGVRWRDEAGRRYVLSKAPHAGDGCYRLTIHRTKEEVRALRLKEDREKRLQKLEERLKEVDIPEARFKLDKQWIASCILAHMFDDKGEVWRFSDEDAMNIRAHVRCISELVGNADLIRRTDRVSAIEAELARLRDPGFQAMLEQIVVG